MTNIEKNFKNFDLGIDANASEHLNLFNESGFPTRKDEAWKYFDISKLIGNDNFTKATEFDGFFESKIDFENSYKVNIVNGKISSLDELPDEIFVSNSNTGNIGTLIDSSVKNSIVNLNSSAFDNVITIDIDSSVSKILHLNFVNKGDGCAIFPRIFFNVKSGVDITIIETWEVEGDDKLFIAPVYEILAGSDVNLNVIKIQDFNKNTKFISMTENNLGSGCDIKFYNVTLNGGAVKNEQRSHILGENSNVDIFACAVVNSNDVIDYTAFIDHAVPNCTSNQLFKTIVLDNAKSNFQGKTLVRQPAQKTDAYQMNRAILLSNDGEINAKPELEIYADDVKCSHGCTMSEISGDELFYLISRGIDEVTAKTLLLEAFVFEVLEEIDDEISKHIIPLITEKIKVINE